MKAGQAVVVVIVFFFHLHTSLSDFIIISEGGGGGYRETPLSLAPSFHSEVSSYYWS